MFITILSTSTFCYLLFSWLYDVNYLDLSNIFQMVCTSRLQQSARQGSQMKILPWNEKCVNQSFNFVIKSTLLPNVLSELSECSVHRAFRKPRMYLILAQKSWEGEQRLFSVRRAGITLRSLKSRMWWWRRLLAMQEDLMIGRSIPFILIISPDRKSAIRYIRQAICRSTFCRAWSVVDRQIQVLLSWPSLSL
jgi:hypothetical protein